MKNRSIKCKSSNSIFVFHFLFDLIYLHTGNFCIRISIYKRKPVPIIVQINNSLNNMSKNGVAKEYPIRRNTTIVKIFVDFFTF